MFYLEAVLFLLLVVRPGISMPPKPCSDTVSPIGMVNGRITIEPASTVAPGTNITIVCTGTDAKPPPGERPSNFIISSIRIFRGSESELNLCIISGPGKRECTLSRPNAQKTDALNYSCVFVAAFSECVISQALTVTDDECLLSPSPCHANATCKKTPNSFNCTCDKGFSGNGSHCEDLKECSLGSPCHKYAHCIELEGSFDCNCREGFTGNGTYCEDIKECSLPPSCHKDATCKELEGSYNCSCKEGYTGNGTHCEEITGDGTSSSSRKWIIIGVVCGFVVVFAGVFIKLFFSRRKNSRQNAFKGNLERRVTAVENLGILFPVDEKKVESSPRRKLPSIRDHNIIDENVDEERENVLPYICVIDDWEIQRDNLVVFQKKLGGGQFGLVKKGLYKDKSNDNGELPVAVKMLKDAASAEDRTDLLMELHILKEVNKQPHPNVIKLIGAFTSEEPILVITEYCSRGNLRKILRKSRIERFYENSSESYINIVSTLSHRILLKLAADVANGMKHLASHQFVHRDLAARNVLVGSNYEAKVSDFGLARPVSGTDRMYLKSNRNMLPVKWMALESLTHGVFRTSSDIWAFGVLLWEITTLGEEPYPGISPYDVLNYVASGDRMERPPQCSEELYDMMLKCWQANQQDRPTFENLLDQLTEMLADQQQKMYINVVQHYDETNGIRDSLSESLENLSELERYTMG